MTPCTPGGDAPGNVTSMGFLSKPHKLNLILRHIQLRDTPPNIQVGKTQELSPSGGDQVDGSNCHAGDWSEKGHYGGNW